MRPKQNKASKTPPIEISWEAGAPHPDLDEGVLLAALASVLTGLGHGGAGLSVLLTGDERLRELNRRFRGLDQPTDVLSWPYQSSSGKAAAATEESAPMGEIALSLERAQAQAAGNGWPLATEVLRLLVHGCAHLAGYDHQTAVEDRRMKAVEVERLAEIGLRGVYPEDTSQE